MRVAWILWLVAALVSPWLAVRWLFHGNTVFVVWASPIAITSLMLMAAVASERKNVGLLACVFGWIGLIMIGLTLSASVFLTACALLGRG